MLTLFLMSILLATFLLPAAAASARRPRRALRSLLVAIFVSEVAYAGFLRFVFERLQ